MAVCTFWVRAQMPPAGAGVTVVDSAGSPSTPSMSTARTWNVYARPLVRLGTVMPVAFPPPGALSVIAVQPAG